MPSSISGVFEHTSGVKRTIPPHFLACSLFMRKESKFQMIRRIKFATVSKNSFLHTHLQICVVGCGYRIVPLVLCLCLIVEPKYLNTYSAVFWCLTVRSATERQSGIRSLGSVSTNFIFVYYRCAKRRRSWRNPVYLSPVRVAMWEKKALGYNEARFMFSPFTCVLCVTITKGAIAAW